MKSLIYVAKSKDPYQGAKETLGKLDFKVRNQKVYLKINLTGCRPSCDGMGIDIGIVKAVLERLIHCPKITIGESCGKTDIAFKKLGYQDLKKDYPNICLEDIRKTKFIWKKIPKPFHTKEMPFNYNVFTHDYCINIAKMKTHSLAGVSLGLKNIFGFIPTRKQKLMYHPFIKNALLDMNQIVKSDFTIIDGIWGNEFDEVQSTPKHTGVVVAGENILAVDTTTAAIMGINLNKNETYQKAYRLWGRPEIEVLGAKIEEVRKNFRQGCLFTTRLRYMKEAMQSLLYRAVNRH